MASLKSLVSVLAAVVDYAAVGPQQLQPGAAVDTVIAWNYANLTSYAHAASAAGASILVWPEYGLTGIGWGSRDVILPVLQELSEVQQPFSIPCDQPDLPSVLQRNLSCLARAAGIDLVVDIGEVVWCNATTVTQQSKSGKTGQSSDGVATAQEGSASTRGHGIDAGSAPASAACPSDGRWQYNSLLAFGADGSFRAKYRKIHPYFEPFDVPEPPLAVAWDSTFGARLGALLCFDMMFSEPTATLIAPAAPSPSSAPSSSSVVLSGSSVSGSSSVGDGAGLGVDGVVFPTWWVNYPPLITATQMQAAYARRTGVPLLAAGGGLGFRYSGSGIYDGGDDSGGISFYNDGADGETKMLLRQVNFTVAAPPRVRTQKIIVSGTHRSTTPISQIEQEGKAHDGRASSSTTVTTGGFYTAVAGTRPPPLPRRHPMLGQRKKGKVQSLHAAKAKPTEAEPFTFVVSPPASEAASQASGAATAAGAESGGRSTTIAAGVSNGPQKPSPDTMDDRPVNVSTVVLAAAGYNMTVVPFDAADPACMEGKAPAGGCELTAVVGDVICTGRYIVSSVTETIVAEVNHTQYAVLAGTGIYNGLFPARMCVVLRCPSGDGSCMEDQDTLIGTAVFSFVNATGSFAPYAASKVAALMLSREGGKDATATASDSSSNDATNDRSSSVAEGAAGSSATAAPKPWRIYGLGALTGGKALLADELSLQQQPTAGATAVSGAAAQTYSAVYPSGATTAAAAEFKAPTQPLLDVMLLGLVH